MEVEVEEEEEEEEEDEGEEEEEELVGRFGVSLLSLELNENHSIIIAFGTMRKCDS